MRSVKLSKLLYLLYVRTYLVALASKILASNLVERRDVESLWQKKSLLNKLRKTAFKRHDAMVFAQAQ